MQGEPCYLLLVTEEYRIPETLHYNYSVVLNLVQNNAKLYGSTVRVENFEVFLISRFSWVAHHTKFIHVEGGINTREIF